MCYKKILSAILALAAVASLTACQNDETPSVTAETPMTQAVTDNLPVTDAAATDIAFPDYSADTTESLSAVSTEAALIEPSSMTKAEIIGFYKNAAEKSDKTAKSRQVITLKEISINNGQFEGVIDFVMPIMSKLLANNSTEKEGITGGYKNLTEADVKSAKLYASGDNTVIEMVMNEQTSGPREDALSGSVGHAITAVGDIGVVTDQLNDLGLAIAISDKDTFIYYTNPTVKVVIDRNGNIIEGTWSYTVEINLNNYKVGKSTVETTTVIMDNVITLE